MDALDTESDNLAQLDVLLQTQAYVSGEASTGSAVLSETAANGKPDKLLDKLLSPTTDDEPPEEKTRSKACNGASNGGDCEGRKGGDSKATGVRTYKVGTLGSKWQVFGELERQLFAENGPRRWEKTHPKVPKIDLLLADRARVDWGWVNSNKRTRLVNYYRGIENLTNKGDMCISLREYAATVNKDPWSFMPPTFVLRPQPSEENEDEGDEHIDDLRKVARNRHEEIDRGDFKQFAQKHNWVWITKSNRGAKGNNIFITRSPEEVLDFVDSMYRKGSVGRYAQPWVVQQYLERPFLVHQRKFDIRCLVAVDHLFRVYFYREGVLRMASVPYSGDNFENRFVHLTNHCIQEDHPNFGSDIEGNEMFFDAFAEYLAKTNSGKTLDTDLYPQMWSIVRESMEAVRYILEPPEVPRTNMFQFLGFDFMIDADFKVWLLEINKTAASPDKLLVPLIRDFIEVAIDPIFPPDGTAPKRVKKQSKTTTPSSPQPPAVLPLADDLSARNLFQRIL